MTTRLVKNPLALVLPSCALLLGGAGMIGCSVKAQPPTAWTIVTRREAPSTHAPEGAPALGLARFTAAPEVRRTDLAWRSDDGRQIHDTDDRWVDYPDRMIEELCREDLLRSGKFASVTSIPPTTGVDVVLSARVLDFSEWHSGTDVDARVAVEWKLTRVSGELLAQDVSRAQSSLSERSVAGAVKAYQDASEQAIASMVSTAAAAAAKLE